MPSFDCSFNGVKLLLVSSSEPSLSPSTVPLDPSQGGHLYCYTASPVFLKACIQMTADCRGNIS